MIYNFAIPCLGRRLTLPVAFPRRGTSRTLSDRYLAKMYGFIWFVSQLKESVR